MRRLIILIVALLVTIVAGLLFFLVKPKEHIDEPVPEVSLEVINKAILDAYQKFSGNQSDSSKTTIDRVEYYQDKWLIVTATHLDEPTYSMARIMTYVIEREEGEVDTLELIAYSGDGFHKNSFPEGTPDHLIERVRQEQ